MDTPRYASPLLLGAALLIAAPASAAVDPQSDYRVSLTCASAAAAANLDVGDSATPAIKAKAEALAHMTLDSALSSGQKIGAPSAGVERRVNRGRDDLLRSLRQPDATKASLERSDLGQVLIKCAIVHAAQS